MTSIAKRSAATIVGMALVLSLGSEPAAARKRHHHHESTRVASPSVPYPTDAYARPPIPYAYSFYPDDIEGGVSGNLPFNNQIRKFRDPLNANGAGG